MIKELEQDNLNEIVSDNETVVVQYMPDGAVTAD